MFVPVEPAFLMALQADGELWADAYKQNILLVGPTTLLYVIRIINVLWQQERQARNVQEVMDRGTELYEKFVGFVTDMEVLGDSLRKSDQHYTNAMKKLADGRGNLIRQVEMLRKLGLRTTKSIPKNLLDRADVRSGRTRAGRKRRRDRHARIKARESSNEQSDRQPQMALERANGQPAQGGRFSVSGRDTASRRRDKEHLVPAGVSRASI